MNNFDQLLPDICRALSPLEPSSVVLGGSYSTNEQCMIIHDEMEYWLSDFDLLIVSEQDDANLVKKVYCETLQLSKAACQQNPYFHIGLKIRTRSQLDLEKNSMYYWELASSGVLIKANSRESLFDSNGNIVSFFSKEARLNIYLYKWGLTRLWCNILFFPINSLMSPLSDDKRVWYSYFYARGAMDWMTWRLLESKLWYPTYSERFKVWSELFCESDSLYALMTKCFDMRRGAMYASYTEIFCDVLKFSLENIRRYKSLSECDQNNHELQFIEDMLHVIANHLLGCEKSRLISSASHSLSMLTGQPTQLGYLNEWDAWHRLREEYCQFRFSHSETDRRDHSVYSKHFLELGAYSPEFSAARFNQTTS